MPIRASIHVHVFIRGVSHDKMTRSRPGQIGHDTVTHDASASSMGLYVLRDGGHEALSTRAPRSRPTAARQTDIPDDPATERQAAMDTGLSGALNGRGYRPCQGAGVATSGLRSTPLRGVKKMLLVGGKKLKLKLPDCKGIHIMIKNGGRRKRKVNAQLKEEAIPKAPERTAIASPPTNVRLRFQWASILKLSHLTSVYPHSAFL